jgi:hypothetical protein
MEDFGARARRPLGECMREVRGSHIYLGIFAMRYGDIPDGMEYSYSHLEYLEAQKLRLPSLIFVIDEDALVRPVDFDVDGAARLKALKKELHTEHVVQSFLAAEDLSTNAARSATALVHQFRTIGHLQSIRNDSILRLFHDDPREYAGVDVEIDCELQDVEIVEPKICRMLGFEPGTMLRSFVRSQSGQMIWLYFPAHLHDRAVSFANAKIVRFDCRTEWFEDRDEEYRFLQGRRIIWTE